MRRVHAERRAELREHVNTRRRPPRGHGPQRRPRPWLGLLRPGSRLPEGYRGRRRAWDPSSWILGAIRHITGHPAAVGLDIRPVTCDPIPAGLRASRSCPRRSPVPRPPSRATPRSAPRSRSRPRCTRPPSSARSTTTATSRTSWPRPCVPTWPEQGSGDRSVSARPPRQLHHIDAPMR